MRVDVVYAGRQAAADGVGDYSDVLVRTLRDLGHEARLTRWLSPNADLALLQYTPFSWGSRGLAPTMPARVAAFRRRHPELLVGLMVHEPYVVDGRLRDRVRGRCQRVQLAGLRSATDVSFSSIEAWRALLSGIGPRRPVFHAPVGSTLPDQRSDREGMRERLAIPNGETVLAAFDSRHPGRSRELLQAALAGAQASGAGRLLLLGAEADPAAVDHAHVMTPGRVDAKTLGAYLAASDIFLAPFSDGVSTRRTTLMAALQHGLPTIGTRGHLTDPELDRASPGLMLADVDRPDDLAAFTAHLVADRAVRADGALAARALYETRFDWPATTRAMVEALQSARANRST